MFGPCFVWGGGCLVLVLYGKESVKSLLCMGRRVFGHCFVWGGGYLIMLCMGRRVFGPCFVWGGGC